MRTTIELDEDLLREVKTQAARKGITLKAFIEDALRETLARRAQARNRQPVRLPVGKGKLMPGVDLSSYAALLDVMEEGLDVSKRR